MFCDPAIPYLLLTHLRKQVSKQLTYVLAYALTYVFAYSLTHSFTY